MRREPTERKREREWCCLEIQGVGVNWYTDRRDGRYESISFRFCKRHPLPKDVGDVFNENYIYI